METTYIEKQGRAFLKEATELMAQGKAEDVLRHALSAKLPLMFPEQPWWIKSHVTGAEDLTQFHEHGKKRYGFVDVLVGSTVIEYERNLNASGAFEHGLHQVKQYCAGQLNDGKRADLVLGVLSDTVRWHAFAVHEVRDLQSVPGATSFGPGHIELIEIDSCNLSAAGKIESKRLGAFLIKHLGREGGRLLVAEKLSVDFGLDSVFCASHLDSISKLVDDAFASDPAYAALIIKLWTDFVSYLGGETVVGKFDRSSYVKELYILTLAKLICANVLSESGLISDDNELQSILGGSFFKARGLPNLVEYDYFGWLNESPHVGELSKVAREIQEDLRAYDFETSPVEDLFGSLMAQLAARSQRLLLGQEWTPSWLASKLIGRAMSMLPADQKPHFLDMCCGSGAMVVETVKQSQVRLIAGGSKPGDAAALNQLTTAVTAFDIDPLAVMLAKVGWVLACKDWLVAGHETQIPVYHADSLFANTPITKAFSPTGVECRKLCLDTEEVELPEFLLKFDTQPLFDGLLSRGYEMAMSSAGSQQSTLTSVDILEMIDSVADEAESSLSGSEKQSALQFCKELLRALEKLQRAGRNGIWAFVLRNSFRPALVAGRFNGLVTNPPWLALSKIGSNPYRDALKSKAEAYGIKAPGASHLHVEIATIFALHAIDRYLSADAVIASVLPDTVLNGAHHEPFRLRGYLAASRPVMFCPTELWSVARGTFKNEAIVLFGKKSRPEKATTKLIGYEVSRQSDSPQNFHFVSSGGRTAWTTNVSDATAKHVVKGSSIGPLFRQGADVMPRGTVFHAAEQAGSGWNLGPIIAGSPFYFLRADGHRLKDFALTAKAVSDKVMFDVLLSKHLAPYDLATGAKALLPFHFGSSGWESQSGARLAALGVSTSTAINSSLAAINESAGQFFNTVDTARRKLRGQSWARSHWVIFASAGGKFPCAAYVSGSSIPCRETIIDQTLYWGLVRTEDEAIFITGLINSSAAIKVIKAHQPRGAFGERHIHKLVFDRTPKYVSTIPTHAAVVDATKTLLAEWEQRKNQPDIQPLLNSPQKHLITRRKRMREALAGLNAWDAYDDATHALYGI